MQTELKKNLTLWRFLTSCNQRYHARQLSAEPVWIKDVMLRTQDQLQQSQQNMQRALACLRIVTW